MNWTAVLVVVILVLIVLSIGAYVVYRYLKILREAKNYERGLKMVPLLIHLPPSSSDTEAGSRDSRDVADETISKAQVLYDIIASTAQEGFKSKFYGQRHISFEIVATNGMVHYYSAVPVALVEVVKQAIVSAYSTAQIEEVSEHNIFSPVGKLSGTIGGELVLKGDYMHPIATYQETKRDAMQSLLNSLSNLDNDDGAGIQILLRPAKKGWEKRGIDEAKKRKEGKSDSSFDFFGSIGNLFAMLGKPPEEKDDKQPKQLTNLEQSNIDAIESKTKHAAYETLIRVVASSNTAMRSQSIVSNIVATFALFDAPGKNGFTYNEAKDIESFVTAYILRFFPPEVNDNILNSVELATVFHFPDQSMTPTSQVQRQESKTVDGPRNIPEGGLLLGYNVFRGVKKEIRLSDNDRRRHMYTVGQTGTGKSTLLENLALQDMIDGKGFAFVDPHGDAAEKLLSMVPVERKDDVVYFNPANMDYPLGLNLFEFQNDDQKDFLIQETINMLYKLYDPQRQGIIGPRYEHMFRNAALALMADPGGSTFIDIPKLFNDPQYVKQKLKHVNDPHVIDFWTKEVPASQRSNDFGEVKSWFVSKFGAFLSNQMMRNIIGQTESAFDLREIMDNKKILLVNLSKGKTGDLNSKLLGMIFVMKFQAAAMSRANIPEDQRVDFSLYVDEFQNFSTDSFATILSEARKYRLNLIVANQFITQLTEEIRDAVFGNVGSIVAFRTSANDAEFLVKQFTPTFNTEDLMRIPNFHSVVKIMISNIPSQPFSMAALPPLGNPNPEFGKALERYSSVKYGKPRAKVEKMIYERLKTDEPTRPKPTPGGPGSLGSRGVPAGAKPGGSSSSFLDDWLAKKRAAAQKTNVDRSKLKPSTEKNIDNLFKKPPASPQAPTSNQPADSSKVASQPQGQAPSKPQAQSQTNTTQPPASDNKNNELKIPKDSNFSGEQNDRAEIANISKALKDDIKPKTNASEQKQDESLSFEENDEVYIDKDGNIHYKNK